MIKGIKIKLFGIVTAVVVGLFSLCACDSNDVTPTPSNETHEKSRVDIVESSEKFSVEIATVSKTGTGTIIDSDADSVTIATCYHLTGYDAGAIELRFYGEDAFESGKDKITLLGYSEQFDLAIFKVCKADFNGDAPTKASGLQKKGTGVVVLGNAFGLGISAFEGVVSLPETIESEEGYLKPMMRITAAGNQGNSGAPVFTEDGKLLGIVLGKRTGGEGMTYVLPIAIVDALYDNAKDGTSIGNIEYTAIKFTSGETTENGVTKRNVVVSLGNDDNKIKVKYANGEFLYSDTESNTKIKKINGNDMPNNIIDFTAEIVRKHNVTFLAGGKTYEI